MTAQTAEIAGAKQIIYDGFRAALAGGAPAAKAGILVDEQFGAAILRDAAAKGIITACPAEKSGQDEFDFEYGEDFARHIEAFDPTFCKVLVRYNPEGDRSLNQQQAGRLKRLSDYLAGAKRSHFMFELLVPAEKAQLDALKGDKRAYDLQVRPRLMVEAIRELQKAGVEPDLWKIEGLDRREDCEAVVAAARAGGRDRVGCIVLGRGENEQKVREWLGTAAQGAGLHRLCRRPHRLLGSACRLESREGDARAGGRPDRQPLSRVRRPLRREVTMQLGMIGLGRMGANMVRRLLKGGHRMRGVRHVAQGGGRAGEGKGRRHRLAGGIRQGAQQAARGLADGAGGRGRQDHRRSGCPTSKPATS